MILNNFTKRSFTIALSVFLFISLFVWVGAKGCTQWSNDDKNTTTGTSASLTGLPLSLSISAENSSTITINWTDNFTNESGYKIERKIVGGSYSLLAIVPANTISYTDIGLTDGTTYYYRIKAYNLSFESAYSEEISTMTYGIWTSSLNDSTTPSSRTNHTSLWVDSFGMIIWGGISDTTVFNTGGIYSPTAAAGVGTWTSITTTGAPTSRSGHTAIWTGSKMIIWGGSNGVTCLDTGAVYSPAADSWIAMTTTNAPEPREYHSAIWTGYRMIVWGGISGTAYSNGGVYNPDTDEWVTGNFTNLIEATHASNPSARSKHTALWTGTGSESWRNKMLIWGGESGGTSGALYDPALDIWSTINSSGAPSQRWGFSYVWTGSGTESWRNKLIIWGGYNGTGPLNNGAVYCPNFDTWGTLATTDAPTVRMYHTGIWTGTKMIIWGGSGSSQAGGVYDPAISKWTTSSTTNVPTARVYHSAVWDGSKMIIWGGWNGIDYFASGGLYTSE